MLPSPSGRCAVCGRRARRRIVVTGDEGEVWRGHHFPEGDSRAVLGALALFQSHVVRVREKRVGDRLQAEQNKAADT
jgi:hypothetical protein